MDDSQILELYWERNPDAVLQTDRKYGLYCRQVSFNILRSREDAEECVNDSWLKAWHSIPPTKPRHLRAYLAKLTRNVSLDRWDQLQAQKRGGGRTALLLSELSDCIPAAGTVEQALEDRAISAAVSAWLRQQNPRNRVAFVRRYWYADSLTDIVQMTNMSYSSISVRLHRTKNKLKNLLAKEGVLV